MLLLTFFYSYCNISILNGGNAMATEKITISEQLRNHIIERRKEYEYTAAELSEKSGHSKYWLQI